MKFRDTDITSYSYLSCTNAQTPLFIPLYPQKQTSDSNFTVTDTAEVTSENNKSIYHLLAWLTVLRTLVNLCSAPFSMARTVRTTLTRAKLSAQGQWTPMFDERAIPLQYWVHFQIFFTKNSQFAWCYTCHCWNILRAYPFQQHLVASLTFTSISYSYICLFFHPLDRPCPSWWASWCWRPL